MQLHPAQYNILYALRHKQSARYSYLKNDTNLESDSFKFHIKKLSHLGYIKKLDNGEYTLTQSGKEFSNNLDKKQRITQKQPKLSLLLIVQRHNINGELEILCQKRLRSPFYGYWGFVSGPMKWGEEPEVTACYELQKQTNLTASFEVIMHVRKKDYRKDTGELLEDKLFTVLTSNDAMGNIVRDWRSGQNEWLTIEQLQNKTQLFSSEIGLLGLIDSGVAYHSIECSYPPESY